MSIESMPRNVIWAGIGIGVVGGVLVATAPLALSLWWMPNTEDWLSAGAVMETLIVVARTLLAPFGAALVAAGLVMLYIDKRLRGEAIADRPRRWRFPPPEEQRTP
ncbi:hypothetical protein ACFQ58_04160 [Agromyces sp. NPDC056523]|uniref:hypothetical protein n=1 Tax=Agromyces sp. NPDC056523 TaxID=3345850 RepID=UPI00366BEA5A